MIQDFFKLAISNLKKRKLRSWLTIIGIIISISTIFTLISLSLGLQGAIEEQFEVLGTDKMFIMPKGGIMAPGADTATQLSVDDVEIVNKVSGVKKATYFTSENVKIEYNDEVRYLPIFGIPVDGFDLYFDASMITIEDGQKLKSTNTQEVLLGWDFKYNKVFEKQIRAGSNILLNDVEYEVSGIMSRVGNPQDDKNIIMEIEDFKTLFDTGDRVDYIIIQIEQGQDVKDVSERIKRRLMKFRDVDEKTIDFSILTPEELLATFKTILSIITGFLGGIAAISLLVGGIGIANTMYTSVLERTREIGVMKAIGARNSDILIIFLIEAGLIGAVGGIAGVGLGILMSKSVEYIAVNQLGTNLLKAAIPLSLVAGCISFAFLIGAISGLVPANNASKIKTVDALRYE